MYNSQKINNDPMPFLAQDGRRYTLAFFGAKHAPRPEFDNNPNPILVAFRGYCQLDTFGCVSPYVLDVWESAYAAYDGFGGYGVWEHQKNTFYAFTVASDEHIDHARKVLQRLAALVGAAQ